MDKVWVHLHLPKWNAYLGGSGDSCVISVKSPGQKIRYVSEITLRDATFFVSAAGRERTLRTGHRNVHAWVIGREATLDREMDYRNWHRAVYDPWKGATFVDSENFEPVEFKSAVHMIGKDVYYLD